MRFLLLFFVFILHCTQLNAQISFADLTGQKDEDEPANIYNRTYSEEQNALQRQIFTKYDRNTRPKRDQTRPTVVAVHVHLMHFSVQERKQSIRVFGHLYLSWYDEKAVWDPSKFNNAKTTLVSQWELWQPDIKVANSISGVNQYFEISKRSHATLHSVDPNRTKVELYPTFSISVGCDFDFTNYPFDEQTCELRFYTSSSMNEVELTLYYGLNPSVILSWDSEEETNKKHISDWELLGAESNTTYFRYREYNNTKPTDPQEITQTWSMITCAIRLRRNTLNYWFTLALPGFTSLIVNLLSFLVYKVETAMLMLIFNFFMQVIFLHDSLDVLPLSVGKKPNIVIFSTCLMFFTFLAILLQVWLKLSAENKWAVTPTILQYTDMVTEKTSSYWNSLLNWINSFGLFTIPVKSTTDADEYESFEESGAKDKTDDRVVLVNGVLRKICIAAYLLLAFCLSFLLFF